MLMRLLVAGYLTTTLFLNYSVQIHIKMRIDVINDLDVRSSTYFYTSRLSTASILTYIIINSSSSSRVTTGEEEEIRLREREEESVALEGEREAVINTRSIIIGRLANKGEQEQQ